MYILCRGSQCACSDSCWREGPRFLPTPSGWVKFVNVNQKQKYIGKHSPENSSHPCAQLSYTRPLSLTIIISKSKGQGQGGLPSPCLGLRTKSGCRSTSTHSHVPFGHGEGCDHCLLYLGKVSLAHIWPGMQKGTPRQMLTALRVDQREIYVGQCCKVPGKSRTAAKFCSSNWQIMYLCTFTHSHGTH